MKPNWDDKKLKALFQKLHEKDELQTPSFQRVWGAALSKGEIRRPARPFVRYAVAALTLFILVSALLFYDQYRRLSDAATAISISEWRSPTHNLLDFPGSNLSGAIEQQDGLLALAERNITHWEPPSEALMKSPESALLNAVPRIGQPGERIKVFRKNELN